MRKVSLERGILGAVGLMLLYVVAVGTDDEIEGLMPKKDPNEQGNPPTEVPVPDGWSRYRGTVTEPMTEFAQEVLRSAEPLGTLLIGGELELGGTWAAFVEWHYHPKGEGYDAEGWHRGVSIMWRAPQ